MKIERIEGVKFPFTIHDPRDGLHLSQISRDMENVRELRGTVMPEPFTEEDYMVMEPGFFWEEVLSIAFGRMNSHDIVRPPAITKDGIKCSPDGIYFSESSGKVMEYKFTSLSSGKQPPYRESWIRQVMAYCYITGCSVAEFHIYHSRGDYKGKPVAHYRAWRLEFTAFELVGYWESVVNHAKWRGWLSADCKVTGKHIEDAGGVDGV